MRRLGWTLALALALGACDKSDGGAVSGGRDDATSGESGDLGFDASGEQLDGPPERDARPRADARPPEADGPEPPPPDAATPPEPDAATPPEPDAATPPEPDARATDPDAAVAPADARVGTDGPDEPEPDAARPADGGLNPPDMNPNDDFECIFDRDCESDQRCEIGFCVVGCRENECDAAEVCRDGECEIPLCASDADCPEESFCAGGLCIPGCRHEPDNCPPGQRCNALNICEIFIDCLAAEICGNGVDDNCDQRIDEEEVCGLPCLPGRDCDTGLLGACGVGQTSCIGDRQDVVRCDVRVEPVDEVCNGRDDDCDGEIDEAYPQLGRPCTAGVGYCASLGTWICTAEGGVRCDAVRGLGRTELCDGQDDDCDGAVDENFPELGGPCTNGLGACATPGVRVCTASGERTTCDARPGAPDSETCDNVDNDCNGRVDDAVPADPCYDGPEGTLGVGTCAAGGRRCQAGGRGSCEGQVGPIAEVCNGLDDDCDGQVDEDAAGQPLARACYSGPGGTSGVGLCHGGTQTCTLGRYGVCAGEVTPGAEFCDGQDNDCNGQRDDGANGCGCQPGAVRNCYTGPDGTQGVGLCRGGTQTCGADGRYGTCNNQRLPAAEACDGADNDCDGRVDDSPAGAGQPCSNGRGACRRDGLTVCDSAAGGLVCNAVAGAPAAETCDGVDNNCDGRTDEGFRLGGACTAGSGSCARSGVYVCQGGASVCSAQAVQASPEICDGLDNDCDGTADDGLNVGTLCSAGEGACQANGRIACEGGQAVCNARPLPPQPELCDHFDNDCDGEEDEGYRLGEACSVGTGACQRNGVLECAADGGTQCSAVAGNGRPEMCNGQDDDCDGRIDEGDPGGGVGCDAGGVGVCITAHTHCRAGRVVCEPDVRPSAELCDGLDNDCDGQTDEELGQTTCGVGPCRHAVDNCVQGRVQVCQPFEGAIAERCDGQDNDCDGTVDNNPGDAGGACSAGIGTCARAGVLACRDGALSCPAVEGRPGVEACNGLDDDCDGRIDEGRTCPDDTPPEVEVHLDNDVVRAGQTVVVTVVGVDDHEVSRLALTANGAPLALDPNNQARYVAAAPGEVVFVGTAWDAWDNQGQGQATLRIADPNDNERPYVRITSPPDLETLTGVVQINGTVRDPGFESWELEVSSDQVTWTLLATGDAAPEDEPIGQLDPTLLLPGFVFVRLTGYDLGGLSSWHMVAWRVPDGITVGEMKLGSRDVEIPLKGFLVTVDRVYDSRDRTMGDFGYGWRLKGQDVGLFEDITGNVAVELPDGRREVFAIGYAFNPVLPWGTILFTAAAGVSSKLEPIDNCVAVRVGGLVYCFLTDGRPPQIINNYRITTAEGVVHEIDQGFGTRLIRDREGNTLTFTNDGVSHSSGIGVAYTRDGLGRITAVTDPEGAVIRYGYDAFGHLTTVTDAVGGVTRYTYDNRHRLVDVTLPDGSRASRTEYDADGRKIRQLDALGRAIVYEHDLPNRRERVTDRLGNTTSYTYDAGGRVVLTVDAAGNERRTTYDAGGRVTEDRDELGASERTSYTAHGLVETRTDPEGRVRRAGYDALDRLVRQTDPLGASIQITYNAQGRQETMTNAVGGLQRWTYDADGNRETLTTPTGELYRYTYDEGGNITGETTPDGRTLSYTYDRNGRMVARQENDAPPLRMDYDPMGRLLAVTLTNDASLTIERDPLGRPITFTDAEGAITRYAYLPTGPLSRVTDPLGRVTQYEYDAEGNLTGVLLPDGTRRAYAYDSVGRPTSRTLLGGGQVRYAFGPTGQLDSLTTANGEVIRFEYDRSGLPVGQLLPDGTHWTQRVDAAGRAIATDGPTGPATAAWDADGRLLRETTPDGEITYTWDRAGKRTAWNAFGQACTWDGPARANGTATLTCNPGGAVRFTYDAEARPVRVTYPNGVVTTFAWTDGQRITAQETRDAQGNLRVARTYETDLVGRPVVIGQTDGGRLSLAYDALGQLVSSRREGPDGALVRTRAYQWDAGSSRSRRTTSEGGAENESFDWANRRAALGAYDLTHDLAGRVVSRVERATGVRETYTYDANDRLVGYLRAAANGARLSQATYAYDASGRRVRRTVDGLERRYAYDGEQLVAELDARGAVVARFVHGPELDTPLLMVRGNEVYTYVQDARGDVVALLDAAGRAVNRYEYDDFGEILSSQVLVENPLTFQGRELDAESGLYHMRARAYDPRTGRFLQPDLHPGSLRVPLTQNPYIFGRNDPWRHGDPLGTMAALEYGLKLSEIFGMKTTYGAPNGYEMLGSLIGFFHGFAITPLAFLGFMFETINQGGDPVANWGACVDKAAAKMEEIKGLMGYFENSADNGFHGAYMNGAGFSVGIKFTAEIKPPPLAGEVMDILNIENPAKWSKSIKVEKSYGGFGNGVNNALEYLRLVGPQ